MGMGNMGMGVGGMGIESIGMGAWGQGWGTWGWVWVRWGWEIWGWGVGGMGMGNMGVGVGEMEMGNMGVGEMEMGNMGMGVGEMGMGNMGMGVGGMGMGSMGMGNIGMGMGTWGWVWTGMGNMGVGVGVGVSEMGMGNMGMGVGGMGIGSIGMGSMGIGMGNMGMGVRWGWGGCKWDGDGEHGDGCRWDGDREHRDGEHGDGCKMGMGNMGVGWVWVGWGWGTWGWGWYSAAPVGGPKPALELRTDHVSSAPSAILHETILSATIPCKFASSVVEPVSSLRASSQVLHHPQSSDPRRASLSSDMSDYDFTQFGQWDGDSASYFNDGGQPPTPQNLSKALPPPVSNTNTSSKTSTAPPLSGLPSPITRPTTPLEYEEEYNPEFDIRTQVAVRSTPRSPTPELVYPDPPSEPTPISRPQGPLSPPPNQENILPAAFFRPPSCVNSRDEHPHQYTAVYTEEGESWRPASNSLKDYFQRIPRTTSIVLHPRIFPSVTPFRIPPPHLYTLLPRVLDPTAHPNFPALHICSKAILDLPSADLPLGTVRYDFREGLRNAFAPLSNIIRAGYTDSLVTLEIQDFFDGRIVTTYGHLRFTFGGQVFAHYQGYFFEDIIRSNPSLLAYCISPRVPADPFDFIPTVPDDQPL
ncbi:hypothetical protein EDB89DRAFT_1915589 [Lactarius sanguifluus]|nr:hypothetical protein EDB89DRAFT_1915589 [Lactarius sanguifluus]